MEALRVEDLSKAFGGVQAVQCVSLSMQVGDRLAIIGPNGAGKTTLISLISGELFPTSGRIYLFGRDVTVMPVFRRVHQGLGRSFQLNNLFVKLSVLDNVLAALLSPEACRFQMLRSVLAYYHLLDKAHELLVAIDLWDKRNVPVGELSYGEQRQLELVLSLALKPRLLLLDEASAGLTVSETARMMDLIRNLGRDITILIIDHDMELVFGLAERIIALHYGRIIAQGTPEEVQADSTVKQIYMGIDQGIGHVGVS